MQKFKIAFNFKSLLSMAGLIGFSAGVVSIPFQLLNFFTEPYVGVVMTIVFMLLSPIFGLVNGLFLGFFAYPFYWYITKKVGFSYEGKINVIE